MSKTFSSPQQFSNAAWNETAVIGRPDGVKVTRVEAEFQYEGSLAGQSVVAYLMLYRADGTGTYSGWERFEGTFEGQPGQAIFRHEGTFDPRAVRARVTSVPEMGLGALAGARLAYTTELSGHGPYPFEWEKA